MEITMHTQNQHPMPDLPSVPSKRGRPPKTRVEVEENEDLEVDEGKEEGGGYPDPSRLPIRE
jgi:hypothetical protein